VNKLVIKLNRKKTHLSSFTEWGYGEVLIQDIHNHYRDDIDSRDDDDVDTNDYLDVNGDDKNHIKEHDCGREYHSNRDIDTITRRLTMDNNNHDHDHDDNDLWVPILRSTTGEQIGVMLISAVRTPV
jgi:hypothetical protein